MKRNQTERFRRVAEFEVNEHCRQATQIDAMIADLGRICIDLGHQIEAEETRARIHDPAHFAYPTYAKAARERHANIQRSMNALKAEFDRLRSETAEAGDQQHAA